MTLSEAQTEAARKATNRGCDADCSCPECISDEIDVAAARWGLNVEAIQQAGREARAVTSSRPNRRGSGNGVGGGRPVRKRAVKLPSLKQLDLIASLLEQRDAGGPQAEQTLVFMTYAEDFDGKRASTLIDALFKLPRRGQAEREAQRVAAEAQLEAGRLYAQPEEGAPGGVAIYRVERSKSSGRLYALRVLAEGGTDYAPGVVTKLDPKAILSLEAAQAWGRETGTCCNCYARLTNPKSIELGIGPVCRGRI